MRRQKDDVTDNSKRGLNVRWDLSVGGEGLDGQFEMVANNHDMYGFVAC